VAGRSGDVSRKRIILGAFEGMPDPHRLEPLTAEKEDPPREWVMHRTSFFALFSR